MTLLEYLPQFMWSQTFVTPPCPEYDFSGQVVIVTGANVGLGLEASRHLVRLNAAKVILAVRTAAKGETAKASIEQTTGKQGVVEVWNLDLASYESVKAFAQKARSLPRLDALIENAGISTRNFVLAEGHESTITTNVISTFLLGLLLLPKLRETMTKYDVTPRLTIVSSEVHFFTSIPWESKPKVFEKLRDRDVADMPDRYHISKLLEMLYFRELVQAVDQSSKPVPILNIINPGLCGTNLIAGQSADSTFVKIFLALFGRTAEVGSRTLVTAACAGRNEHGKYMSDGIIAKSDEGEATGKRVWEELNEILEAIQPGILKNI